MRILEPHTITVLTTSRCTAACRHCCMHSSPSRSETLSYAQIESILTDAFDAAPEVTLVVFAGGEPTLLGEDLNAAIALCKRHAKHTRLVTNASWAHTMAAARAAAAALRNAGLDEINISTDDYHLPWISLQRVRFAFDAAMEAGFSSVVLANCFGRDTWLTPDRLSAEFGGGAEMKLRFDQDGFALEHEVAAGQTRVLLSNAYTQRIGRGVEQLEEAELPLIPEFDALAKGLGGCPYAVRSMAISPKGHVLSCCGFELEDNAILDFGDAASEPVGALLDRANNDLITHLIAFIGPPALRAILEKAAPDEADFRPSYKSYCELCQDLVAHEINTPLLHEHMGLLADIVLDDHERLEARRAGDGPIVGHAARQDP